jgi:hypothetical protein
MPSPHVQKSHFRAERERTEKIPFYQQPYNHTETVQLTLACLYLDLLTHNFVATSSKIFPQDVYHCVLVHMVQMGGTTGISLMFTLQNFINTSLIHTQQSFPVYIIPLPKRNTTGNNYAE